MATAATMSFIENEVVYLRYLIREKVSLIYVLLLTDCLLWVSIRLKEFLSVIENLRERSGFERTSSQPQIINTSNYFKSKTYLLKLSTKKDDRSVETKAKYGSHSSLFTIIY